MDTAALTGVGKEAFIAILTEQVETREWPNSVQHVVIDATAASKMTGEAKVTSELSVDTSEMPKDSDDGIPAGPIMAAIIAGVGVSAVVLVAVAYVWHIVYSKPKATKPFGERPSAATLLASAAALSASAGSGRALPTTAAAEQLFGTTQNQRGEHNRTESGRLDDL